MEEIERLETGASTRAERWGQFQVPKCSMRVFFPCRSIRVQVGPGGSSMAAAICDDVQQEFK